MRNLFRKYYEYFSDNQVEFYKWVQTENKDGNIALSYPVYDDGVLHFIRDISNSDFMDYNYNESLSQYQSMDISQLISTSDLQLLKSILTYYVRQERFNDGAWVCSIEQKVFLNIIKRFLELI